MFQVLKLILQPTEVIPVYEVKAQPARTEVGEEEVGVEVQESLPLPSFIGKYFGIWLVIIPRLIYMCVHHLVWSMPLYLGSNSA